MAPSALDKNSGADLNTAVLKRMDPDVSGIMCTASHVALYEFDMATHQWGRKNVEGTLFLVKRRTAPRFKFIVMNGKGTDNYMEEVDGEMTVEQMESFILYTRKPQGLTGIWFYETADRNNFMGVLHRVVASLPKISPQEEAPRERPAPVPPPGPREGPEDGFWDKSGSRGLEHQNSGPAQEHLLQLFQKANRPPQDGPQEPFPASRSRQGGGGTAEAPPEAISSAVPATSGGASFPAPGVTLLTPSTFVRPSSRPEAFENGGRESVAAPSPLQLPMPPPMAGGEPRMGQGGALPLGQGALGGVHPIRSRSEGNGFGDAGVMGSTGLERFFSGNVKKEEVGGGEEQVRERVRAAMAGLMQRSDVVDAMVAEFRRQGLLC
eukprot:evm.model.scf_1131.1 EVM.evm.TU.scf_1131.1   scf_1131:37305-38441(+)